MEEVTTLTSAYVDSNDERKAVFGSTLSVCQRLHRSKEVVGSWAQAAPHPIKLTNGPAHEAMVCGTRSLPGAPKMAATEGAWCPPLAGEFGQS